MANLVVFVSFLSVLPNGFSNNCAVRLTASKAGWEGLASPAGPPLPRPLLALPPPPSPPSLLALPAPPAPHQANAPARAGAHTNAHAHADTCEPTHGPAPCAADTSKEMHGLPTQPSPAARNQPGAGRRTPSMASASRKPGKARKRRHAPLKSTLQ